MNRELAEAVVGCLRFAGEAPDVSGLRRFNARDWQRTFPWLDRSGLTLYLVRHLQDLGATELLPPTIRTRFEGNVAENRRRLDYIANEFASINQKFHRAGVNFAVVKGFSLVPAYCPDAVLRAVSDLDYLVDRKSLLVAQRALEEEGYCLQRFSDTEFKFGKPSSRMATFSDDPYSRETKPLVELHLAFWREEVTCLPLHEPEFRVGQTTSHEWQGLRFPVLREEDAFILQIRHVFQHMLECWIKLCWLLEIGYFLKARAPDNQLWERVDVHAQEVPNLVEFTSIVMGLVDRVFTPPMPLIAEHWTQSLRPAASLWLEKYGQDWVIAEHPVTSLDLFSSAKLCLFLHREYIPDPELRNEVTRRRLLPWKRPERIAVAVSNKPAGSLQARWLQWQLVLRRLIFHFGSSLRYCCEVPRWRQLSKRSAVLLSDSSQKPVSSD